MSALLFHEEEILRRRLESMGRLAGGLAHDLNNMLAIISGYVDLIADPLVQDNPEERDNTLSELRLTVDRGAALTRQLLNLGSSAAGAEVRIQPAQVILGMDGLLKKLVPPPILLETHIECPDSWLTMQPMQLEQIVMNLILNARDAVQGGGNIKLTASRVDASRICICVADEGVGIPLELQQRIFEPFVTTKGKAGTGLGLALVQQIVEAHGGTIQVHSEPLKGSQFSVYLPIC